MCEPTVVAGVIAGGISLGFSVAGGIKEGDEQVKRAQAQADEATFMAEQAERNAGLADRQARDSIERGFGEAGEAEVAGRQATEEGKAIAAGAGVSTTTGSTAQLLAQSGIASSIDAGRLRANAAREAWGHRFQAEEFRREKRSILRSREEILRGGYSAKELSTVRTVGNIYGQVGSNVSRLGGM